ncbi:MAG: hypothetical protein J6K45_06360 [Clostridia bacterium]|nr:hypothetical protein [Clostridia bacterium]
MSNNDDLKGLRIFGKIYTILITFILIGLIIFIIKGVKADKELAKSNENTVAVSSTSSTSSNEKKEYECFKGTDIPTPQSVLNYKKPFISMDQLDEDGSFYGGYMPYEDDEFNSNVKNPSDYEKYSEVITNIGYKLDKTEDDEDGAKIYTYSNNSYEIKLRILADSFEITLTKKES